MPNVLFGHEIFNFLTFAHSEGVENPPIISIQRFFWGVQHFQTLSSALL